MSLLIPVLIALTLGAIVGYLATTYMFREERKRMAADWRDIAFYHEQHSERLRMEETRLGINEGIRFAVDEMNATVEHLREHVKEYTPND